MDNDFDKELSSDEELNKKFDELILHLGEKIAEDESKTAILNPLRLQQLQFAHAALKYITKGMDALVSYKLYEPYKTMGSVSVEASHFKFDNPEWFARIAEFANNTEVYPLANGKIRITFTFHGLTNSIE